MRILDTTRKILVNRKWLSVVIRRVFYAFMRFSVTFASIKLKREANKCNSIKDCVNLAFNIFNTFPFRRWSIKPGQEKEEIMKLLKVLAKRKPKYILEIGTAGGGTLFLFAKVSSLDALIISVDLPGGRFGGGYPEWRVPFYESFSMHRQKIRLIRGNSHAIITLNMIEEILEGHRLDFLFIDGDHTYSGVEKDFEMYRGLVRKDGMIAFHDIVPGSPEYVGGVPRFWDEIKHNFTYTELVKDWEQGGCGIGVIYV